MKTLITFGLGALTMYFLDPVQGRRRRALLRDQYVHARRVLREQAGGTVRDYSRPVRTELEPQKPAETPESAHYLGR
jgi:hypothetical protein